MSVIIFCNPNLTGSLKNLPPCLFKKQTGVNVVKAITTVVASISHMWTQGLTQIQVLYSTDVKMQPNHSSIGMKGHLTYTSQCSSQAKKQMRARMLNFPYLGWGNSSENGCLVSLIVNTTITQTKNWLGASTDFVSSGQYVNFIIGACLFRVGKLKP